jgi:DnaJ family protein C protein 2
VNALEQRIGVTRYGEPVKKEEPSLRESSPQTNQSTQKREVNWSEEDILSLQKAIAKYPGGSVDRWRCIARMLRDKFTDEEVLSKTKELESALSSKGKARLQADSSPSATVSNISPAVDEWTQKQQKQLEQGLRELKEYKEKDKWQKVSDYVEGRSAKQCFERFKYLCSLNKK